MFNQINNDILYFPKKQNEISKTNITRITYNVYVKYGWYKPCYLNKKKFNAENTN